MECRFRISFKTIYRDIEDRILNILAKQVLRRKGKSQKHATTETRDKIKNRNMIIGSPLETNNKL